MNTGKIIVLSGLVGAFATLGVAAGSGTASAAPVTIDVETDYQISSIAGGIFETAGFQENEQVNLRFTIDDTTPDSEPDAGLGLFDDLGGFIVIIGATSGASVTTNNGVQLDVEGVNTLEIDGTAQTIGQTFAEDGVIDLLGDFDFDFSVPDLFSNVNDLPTILAELSGTFLFSGPDTAEVTLGDGTQALGQAVFTVGDQHEATFAAVEVPEPATLSLVAVGLAGLGVVARRRRATAAR